MDRKTVCLAGLLWAFLGLAGRLPAAPVEITSVWPDKFLYKSHKDAVITVTIRNKTQSPQTVTLNVDITKELDKTERILDRNLVLTPREEKTVSATWNTSNEEYGFEVKATFKDDQGTTLDEKKEYFMVCDNAYKVGQTMTFFWTFNRESLATDMVADLRKQYVPVLEWFSPWPCNFSDMTPDTEDWYNGMNCYHESRSIFDKVLNACHKNGISVVAYTIDATSGLAGTEFLGRHPEWAAYREEGQLYVAEVESKNIELLRKYYAKMKKGEKDQEYYDLQKYLDGVAQNHFGQGQGAFGVTLACVNTRNFDLVKFATDEIIRSAKKFGYDGVRFDGEYVVGADYDPMNAPSLDMDYLGNPMAKDAAEADRLSVRNMKYFQETVKKALPDFILGYNYGRYYDKLWPRYAGEFRETARGNMKLLEEINNAADFPASPAHQWEGFRQTILKEREHTRTAGGYFYMGFFVGGSPVYWRHLMAITFASNSHLAAETKDKRQYYQFVTRYCGFLYDPKIQWINENVEEKAQVSSEKPIWWKEYMYEKKTNRNLYTILHLLNPPVVPDLSKEMKTPPPAQTNIKVRVAIPKGYQPENVYLLSPDLTETGQALKFKTGDGWIETLVPELQYWDIVVAQWKGDKT